MIYFNQETRKFSKLDDREEKVWQVRYNKLKKKYPKLTHDQIIKKLHRSNNIALAAGLAAGGLNAYNAIDTVKNPTSYKKADRFRLGLGTAGAGLGAASIPLHKIEKRAINKVDQKNKDK